MSQSSAAALTDFTLTLVNSASLSTSTLYLFLASFWNKKLDLNLLQQIRGNRIYSRSSCVLYFQFNFMHQQKYLSWVDPLVSLPKQLNSDIQSEDGSLVGMSMCDASTVYY